jgi:phosphatidate phosphatase PAH1
MKLNETVTINCGERSVTLQDGTRMQAALRLDSDRVDWLRFKYGTNALKFEDTGTLGVTIDTTWSDKVAS